MALTTVVAVYHDVSLDAVVEKDSVAVAADDKEKRMRSERSREEVHIVRADRAVADLVRQGMIGEAMMASWRSSSLRRMVAVAEDNLPGELASLARECLQKYACVLSSLAAMIRMVVSFHEDGGVAVMVAVVVEEEEAVVAWLAEHMRGFGTREQKCRFPWIHSGEAMPIHGSQKVGMRPLVS